MLIQLALAGDATQAANPQNTNFVRSAHKNSSGSDLSKPEMQTKSNNSWFGIIPVVAATLLFVGWKYKHRHKQNPSKASMDTETETPAGKEEPAVVSITAHEEADDHIAPQAKKQTDRSILQEQDELYTQTRADVEAKLNEERDLSILLSYIDIARKRMEETRSDFEKAVIETLDYDNAAKLDVARKRSFASGYIWASDESFVGISGIVKTLARIRLYVGLSLYYIKLLELLRTNGESPRKIVGDYISTAVNFLSNSKIQPLAWWESKEEQEFIPTIKQMSIDGKLNFLPETIDKIDKDFDKVIMEEICPDLIGYVTTD